MFHILTTTLIRGACLVWSAHSINLSAEESFLPAEPQEEIIFWKTARGWRAPGASGETACLQQKNTRVQQPKPALNKYRIREATRRKVCTSVTGVGEMHTEREMGSKIWSVNLDRHMWRLRGQITAQCFVLVPLTICQDAKPSLPSELLILPSGVQTWKLQATEATETPSMLDSDGSRS